MFFVVSDFPEEATWLSDDEKAFVQARLQEDVGDSGRMEKITIRHFLNLFKDCKSTRTRGYLVETLTLSPF